MVALTFPDGARRDYPQGTTGLDVAKDYQDVTELLAIRRIKTHIVYQTDQDDRALALVAAGIGVALVPAHYEVSSVKQVPVSDLGVSRAIGLLWSRERDDDDLKAFIEFAGSHCWAA